MSLFFLTAFSVLFTGVAAPYSAALYTPLLCAGKTVDLWLDCYLQGNGACEKGKTSLTYLEMGIGKAETHLHKGGSYR